VTLKSQHDTPSIFSQFGDDAGRRIIKRSLIPTWSADEKLTMYSDEFRFARDPGAIFDIEELITGEPGRAKPVRHGPRI
jgi:hypothetical protein